MRHMTQRPRTARTLATVSAAAVMLFGGAGTALAQQAPPDETAPDPPEAVQDETPEDVAPGGERGVPEEGTEAVPAPAPETATAAPDDAQLQPLEDLLAALLTLAERPPAEEPPTDEAVDDGAPETGTAAAPETGTAQGQEKETVCHKPGSPAEQTKDVPSPAVEGHLGHGDERGECPDDEAPETATVIPPETETEAGPEGSAAEEEAPEEEAPEEEAPVEDADAEEPESESATAEPEPQEDDAEVGGPQTATPPAPAAAT